MIDAVGEKEGRDHLFKLGDFEGHVGALGGGFLTKVQTNFLNHYQNQKELQKVVVQKIIIILILIK